MKRLFFAFLVLALAAWQSRARRKVAMQAARMAQDGPPDGDCLFRNWRDWDDWR